MRTRMRVIAFGGTAVLIVLGAVLGALIGGVTGGVLVILLVGGGLVVATSLVFLEVGLSEDRERASERKRRPPASPAAKGAAPRPRPLPRLRGRRRRLR